MSELIAPPGLVRAGARPRLGAYVRAVWDRREFIMAHASAKASAGYTNKALGQLWQVLTPLLNAAVYYLVFKVLLKTDRGIENYVAFLVVGIFVFGFIGAAALAGARALSGNTGLTRTLAFPRAVLPLSSTLVAAQKLVVSLVVMVPIVLLTGEVPHWRWLLLVPALTLGVGFGGGLALVLGRVGAQIPDTTELLPFVLRTWLYVSGVFYSIDAAARLSGNGILGHVLSINPASVYIELARGALIDGHSVGWHTWALGVGWAGLMLVGGLVYFWMGEETYGRD